MFPTEVRPPRDAHARSRRTGYRLISTSELCLCLVEGLDLAERVEDRLEVDGVKEELLKILPPAVIASRRIDWRASKSAHERCDSSGKSANKGVLMVGYIHGVSNTRAADGA